MAHNRNPGRASKLQEIMVSLLCLLSDANPLSTTVLSEHNNLATANAIRNWELSMLKAGAIHRVGCRW
jgi:hypothetical protein